MIVYQTRKLWPLKKCGKNSNVPLNEILWFYRHFGGISSSAKASKCGSEILQVCCEFLKCGKSAYVLPIKYCNFATVSRSAIFHQNVGQNHRNTWSACAPLMKVCNFATVFSIAFSTGKVHRKSAWLPSRVPSKTDKRWPLISLAFGTDYWPFDSVFFLDWKALTLPNSDLCSIRTAH